MITPATTAGDKQKEYMKVSHIFIVLPCLGALCACTSSPAVQQEDGFKSMIRLWPDHHENDEFNARLMDAFAKYPNSVDEVWFEFQCIPGESQASIDEKVGKMKAAADRMRAVGIIPSTQVVAIGHPEEGHEFPTDKESLQKNSIGYRPMVSHDGHAAKVQTCPRDTAFANFHAGVYARFCESVKPYAVYIDDDLRLSSHNPSVSGCFCDECIRQFSERTGVKWTREALVGAILDGVPGVRDEWVKFSQESLAVYARIVSRAVHTASPETRMGYQNVAFHEWPLEGWDYKPLLDAMHEETGMAPLVRPGHGYYNDWAPREMFNKAYGISRQINRMPDYVKNFAPEIEGYRHKSTGKSPQSLVTETLLYLGLGANSMSYAIICANNEPMEWYADNYFKYLDRYHRLFKEFTAFNKESHPAGIDSYISPNHLDRDVHTFKEIAQSEHGSQITGLTPLGVPFTPESRWSTATTLDGPSVDGMTDAEIDSLMRASGIVMTKQAWNRIKSRGHAASLKEVPGLGYETPSEKKVAVLDNFGTDWTGAQRNHILDLFDWVAEGKVYARIMTSVQANVIPRIDDSGALRSVIYVNCCITDQEGVVLRLRNCPEGARFIWKSGGSKDVRVKAEHRDGDVFVTIPTVKAWDAGWLAVVPRGGN